MRWVIAMAMLCACDSVFGLSGRHEPDAAMVDGPSEIDAREIDASPAHDEDGDGVDDAEDVCPGIADTSQADADTDGVGDPCDPDPNVQNHRLFFDPFVTLSLARWTPNTAWDSDGETVGPEPNQPHNDGFRLTHRNVELAAGSRWQIDVGMHLPASTSPAIQFIGIHPTNASGSSLWTCAVYYDGEWKVTAGAMANVTTIPTPTVLRTIGQGTAADTTSCAVFGAQGASAVLNAIPYPMLPQIYGQVAIRYDFIDVIQ